MSRSYEEKSRIVGDRNCILDSLKRVEPAPLPLLYLRRALPSQPRWDVFLKDISYLLKNGFIEYVREREGQKDADKWVQLTARGMEAADELIEDQALNPEP